MTLVVISNLMMLWINETIIRSADNMKETTLIARVRNGCSQNHGSYVAGVCPMKGRGQAGKWRMGCGWRFATRSTPPIPSSHQSSPSLPWRASSVTRNVSLWIGSINQSDGKHSATGSWSHLDYTILCDGLGQEFRWTLRFGSSSASHENRNLSPWADKNTTQTWQRHSI